MNFWFEMAINAVEITLILSFLVQYFGYRMAGPAKYMDGTLWRAVLRQCSLFLLGAAV